MATLTEKVVSKVEFSLTLDDTEVRALRNVFAASAPADLDISGLHEVWKEVKGVPFDDGEYGIRKWDRQWRR